MPRKEEDACMGWVLGKEDFFFFLKGAVSFIVMEEKEDFGE